MALKKPVKKAAPKAAPKAAVKAKPAPKTATPKAPAKGKAVSKAKKSKPATPKTATTKKVTQLSGEQLMVENLATLSSLVRTISETLDVLVQKVENMAYHLIATEETLAEVVATTGVDLAQVNKRIRSKIAKGTNQAGDPSRAIDVAAAIASPTPKTRR